MIPNLEILNPVIPNTRPRKGNSRKTSNRGMPNPPIQTNRSHIRTRLSPIRSSPARSPADSKRMGRNRLWLSP